MAIDLLDKECESSECNKGNYFLGSSRTYSYYASWFKDPWQFHPQGLKFFCDNSNVLDYKAGDYVKDVYVNTFFYEKGASIPDAPFKTDSRCISTFASSNPFFYQNQSIGETNKTDAFLLQKSYGIVSEAINEISGEVVKWRDDGIINSIASPLFISFWIGGCGEPCFPCTYENVNCGNPQSMMFNLVDNLDNYWDVFNEDHFPYFNTGFVLDWYGRVARGPEPTIGWYEYFILNSINCNYCHCVYFCILRQCIDGWYATRDYYAKMLLLDETAGLPYVDPSFLENWGKEMQNKYNFGTKDIKLNHLADEAIFIGGSADHKIGTINFDNSNLIGSQENAIELYGQKIPTITEFDYNESFENRQPEASFTTGDGSGVYFIDRIRGSFSPQGGSINNQKMKITDIAVKNKNQKIMPQITGYGWIYTDIPSGVNPEYASVRFSADGGAAFPNEVQRSCPSLGCDLTKTIFDLKLERMFCRTSKSNGEFKKYMDATTEPPSIGGGSYWSSSIRIYDGPSYTQKYYKRYIKKIVKAPYNLYVKSGEKTFRTCKVGETLKNLSPGRYYFPNPITCNAIFHPPDSSYIVDESSIEVDPSEETEFRKIFNLRLNQFKGAKNDIEDLEDRYKEAIEILGSPDGNAMEMEINATSSINISSEQNTNFSENILQAIKELAAAGSLDPGTIALLQQAGLLP